MSFSSEKVLVTPTYSPIVALDDSLTSQYEVWRSTTDECRPAISLDGTLWHLHASLVDAEEYSARINIVLRIGHSSCYKLAFYWRGKRCHKATWRQKPDAGTWVLVILSWYWFIMPPAFLFLNAASENVLKAPNTPFPNPQRAKNDTFSWQLPEHVCDLSPQR